MSFHVVKNFILSVIGLLFAGIMIFSHNHTNISKSSIEEITTVNIPILDKLQEIKINAVLIDNRFSNLIQNNSIESEDIANGIKDLYEYVKNVDIAPDVLIQLREAVYKSRMIFYYYEDNLALESAGDTSRELSEKFFNSLDNIYEFSKIANLDKASLNKIRFLLNKIKTLYRSYEDQNELLIENIDNMIISTINKIEEFRKEKYKKQFKLEIDEKSKILQMNLNKIRPIFLEFYELFKENRYDPKVDVQYDILKSKQHNISLLISNIEELIKRYIKESEKSIQEEQNNYKKYLDYLIFFGIFILANGYFALNQVIMKPIRKLINGTKEFTKGNFSYKISQMHKDEFGELAISFNAMANEIEQKNKNLHSLNNSLEYRLYHDILTGLKNRNALFKDLDKNNFSSLMVIDIDNFRTFNELYGMENGNIILKSIANFLQVHSKNKLYKVYADGFVILEQDDSLDIEKYESELFDLLGKLKFFSVYLENIQEDVELDVTIGISFEYEQAMEKADIALKYAKKLKKPYIAYSQGIDGRKSSKDLLKWRYEIKDAISNDMIIPVFQPIVDREQNIVKYETLMRLVREVDGKTELVSPFFFLDTAVKTKQYNKLTAIVMEKSFQYMKTLGSDFSINISFEDVSDKATVRMLKNQIVKYKLGSQLIVEIVESESILDFKLVKTFIDELKAMDVRIAIDDFGSGYSNYSHILEIVPDYLKLDGSFIKNIDTDKKSYELVKSIVMFAKALGIKTIAEFVSSKEIFEITREIGIDEFQGFYFSPPKQIEEIESEIVEAECV